MSRGALTSKTQELAKKFLGREMTGDELRLIPYVQYVLCNEQVIEKRKVNPDEKELLRKWREEGHILCLQPSVEVTKEFWDFMCEVLWLTYVCCGEAG